ncbi:MAG: response regulator, partial [Paludibacteraceae bacterium]|nr:response regulator [Paludibacteraceae bacterium]
KLICEGMKALLEKHVTVFTANNGLEALELLKQRDFDIILSDVEMPEMSGVEMCEVIRKSAAFKHIPILFLSARTAESDRLLGLLSGAIDYIPKPFSQDELFVKLCNILNMRKLQQERFVAQFMKNTDLDISQEKMEDSEVDPFLEKYLSIIKLRYSESDLSVDSLADAMCVSRATLSRRTKAILGKTPIELLNEFRLNEAMRMLKGGRNSQTVSDVAFASGFNDLAYFSKRFKERFGVSPSAVK